MRRFLPLLLIIALLYLSLCDVYAYCDDSTVLGTVESLQQATNDYGSKYKEMELCDTVADAVRSACNTDIAILNGADFLHNLQGGEATWADIQYLFPEDRQLAVVEISGEILLNILEYGVSKATVDTSTETLVVEESLFDGFPQISGFSFSYDPTAPVGQRVLYAELSDGALITASTTLTLAATENMLSGGFGYPSLDYQSVNMTLAEAMAQFFASGTISAPQMKRIICIGLGDGFIAIPRPVIFVFSIVAIMVFVPISKAIKRTKKENEIF